MQSKYIYFFFFRNSIQWRAKELMNKLLLSNVGDKPIIWVAHSMGGKKKFLDFFNIGDKNELNLNYIFISSHFHQCNF